MQPTPMHRAPAAIPRRVSVRHATGNAPGQDVVMYSDEFGKSMGSQLSRRLAGRNHAFAALSSPAKYFTVHDLLSTPRESASAASYQIANFQVI
ncbi:hypothetical protein EVAR_50171_1 [Eumeta japonica]|uniref:Uncharacterized protein n=1 Tax=Eumeta variegata TaxID=151549 RepID=A0A4C1YZS5_EUMVA|nr:hypothetical protein EVAR_50171_1 [Eumeta japonica]